jgi:plasmid stabilization system protein ParE
MVAGKDKNACEAVLKVFLLSEAESDILAAHDWYETKRAGLGADFELCLEAALGRILEFPEASPIWYRNSRRMILAHFPYGVFYVCKDDAIFVVAVFHLKRRPISLRSFVKRRTLRFKRL